jgi:hypothetical protein
MKPFPFILLLVLLAHIPRLLADVTVPFVQPAGSVVSYDQEEGFEPTGYTLSWSETGAGTLNEDYATSPIVGSQGLQVACSANNAAAFLGFTAASSRYEFFRLRIDSTAAAGQNFFSFRTTTTARGSVFITSAAKLQVQASGGTANTCTDSLPTATNIYVWVEVISGSGADGILRAGWSTDGTKPTLSATGAKSCASTDGTYTSTYNRAYFGATAGSITYSLVFDRVIGHTSAVGANP